MAVFYIVALDGQDTLHRYAPFEALRRAIAGEQGRDAWDDLLRVSGQWRGRYLDRADGYVRPAIVWRRHKGDLAGAAAVLNAGLQEGAHPEGILRYHLAQLQGEAP